MHLRTSNLAIGLLRSVAAAVLRLLCRVDVHGLQHLRAAGPRVMLVANHPSLIDGLLLFLFVPLTPVFAVSPATARRRWLRLLLRFVDWHELDTLNPGAIKSLTHVLREGRALMIFPEGRVASGAALMKVYEGAALIAEHAEAEILPVAIDGPQYSRWSGLRGKVRQSWWPRITLTVLPARRLEVPAEVRGSERRAHAADALLRAMLEVSYTAGYHHETLFAAVVRAARNHGMRQYVLEDATGARLCYRDLLTRALVLGGVLTRQLGARERLGVLLPSTAATVVTLLACAARGRQTAMLNFTAGARGLVTAIETGNVRLVVTSRAFVEGCRARAPKSAPSKPWPKSSISKTCALPSVRSPSSAARWRRVRRCSPNACWAARSIRNCRQWCCLHRARKAYRKAWCCPMPTCWPISPRCNRCSISPVMTAC